MKIKNLFNCPFIHHCFLLVSIPFSPFQLSPRSNEWTIVDRLIVLGFFINISLTTTTTKNKIRQQNLYQKPSLFFFLSLRKFSILLLKLFVLFFVFFKSVTWTSQVLELIVSMFSYSGKSAKWAFVSSMSFGYSVLLLIILYFAKTSIFTNLPLSKFISPPIISKQRFLFLCL